MTNEIAIQFVAIIIAFMLLGVHLILNKKNRINIENINTTLSYEKLVFNSDIEHLDNTTLKESLDVAYSSKRHEEDLLHKYLIFFWGIESVFILLATQLPFSIKYGNISDIKLIALIFISFVGAIFSIHFLISINIINSTILSHKFHIIHIEHYLNRNIYGTFIGTKNTDSIENVLKNVYTSIEFITATWEVALSLSLAYLIRNGRFHFFDKVDYLILTLVLLVIIEIIRILYLKYKYKDIKNVDKIKLGDNVFAIELFTKREIKTETKDE